MPDMPDAVQFNFGQLAQHDPAPRRRSDAPFCIALLGDFSGRAHRGERRSAEELARLKPMLLDADTFDTVTQKLGSLARLRLGLVQGADGDGGGDGAGASVEFNPRSLDDLHPDALYDSLPLFAELARLRQRLSQPATFAAAAAQVRQWAPAHGTADTAMAAPARQGAGRSDAVRNEGSLIDFVALFGLPALQRPPSPIESLIREVVQPHLQHTFARPAPDAAELTAAVDRALSAAMRQVLHHPDFQGLEAAWRSLDFIMRRVETSARLQVHVYDIGADEFAADLAAGDALQDSGLFRLLVGQPALDAQQNTPSALVGLYTFARTAVHAQLLGRIGAIAARAGAPFIAAMGLRDVEAGVEVDAEVDAVAAQAWQALRELPAAHHLGLTTPGFLLRQPYGKRTDPVEAFDFEEFDQRQQPGPLLWGNPALLAAVLLAQHVNEAGADVAPARQLDIDNLPLCLWADGDGGDLTSTCTERQLTDLVQERVQSLGVIPVLQHRGRAEVRFGGFMSLTGGQLAGRWT